MAEEFGVGVCGGNWWNPSRNICSSPRSSLNNHFESLSNWQMMNYEAEMMKLRSCKETASSNPSRVCGTTLSGPNNNNFPIMAPTPSIWNQISLESIDECLLQENMDDSCQFQDRGIGEADDDSPMKGFKQINQELSDLDQSGTANCTSTIASCQGLPTFPIGSDSSQLRCSQLMMQSLLGLPVVNGQSTPPSLKPSFPLINHITPYWSPSADVPLGEDDDIGASLFSSSPPNKFITKRSNGDIENSASFFNEASAEHIYKRSRIETPSSLPTFKVRKEKLGDRVTALQQLVSPFGKTDTASVLNEAVDYIKILHDQVNVLITSHMKNGAAIQQHKQVHHNGLKNGEAPHKKDLRSQGLCLVPISKTYAVANDIRADSQFWALPLGGTFG